MDPSIAVKPASGKVLFDSRLLNGTFGTTCTSKIAGVPLYLRTSGRPLLRH
jgi:hypothetical protein